MNLSTVAATSDFFQYFYFILDLVLAWDLITIRVRHPSSPIPYPPQTLLSWPSPTAISTFALQLPLSSDVLSPSLSFPPVFHWYKFMFCQPFLVRKTSRGTDHSLQLEWNEQCRRPLHCIAICLNTKSHHLHKHQEILFIYLITYSVGANFIPYLKILYHERRFLQIKWLVLASAFPCISGV